MPSLVRNCRRAFAQVLGRGIDCDIVLQQEAHEALRMRDRAIEAVGEGIMITDAQAAGHPVVYVNRAVERITGYVSAELLGTSASFLVAESLGGAAVETLRGLLREKREGSVVLRCRRKDGTPWWNELSVAPVRDEGGLATHTVSIFKDVTQRMRQEEELLRSARYDALTGLPNRALLNDRLEQAIAVASRHGRQVGVLLVDIDNFKMVNDSLGHAAGDLVLRELGTRLLTCLRDGDTVARLGGDEFVLLLNEIEHGRDLVLVVDRVKGVLTDAIDVTGEEIFVSASIGTSTFPRDGDDGNILLRHADIAMYRAKELGRNNSQNFTAEMQFNVSLRMMYETCLRTALEREEFVLHYQPQVSLQTGCIVGAEALIRWHNPDLGLISPAEFIPLAEETGLILPIGEWVLDRACAQAKAWSHQGFALRSVAVNLSARQFRQKNLLQVIERALSANSLNALNLEIELTESMVMQDPEKTLRILRVIKEMGVAISLDDFGTGYSSLSHLRRFPIDVLKVDQSFVRDVTTDADAAAIAASIVTLARNLRLSVIAEGVETRAQLDYMRDQGCDLIQGYYFSKPLPAHEFSELLASGRNIENGGGKSCAWSATSQFTPPSEIEVPQ